MASVASKNLFELLGNDPDEDGEIRLPVIPVDKQAARKGKRNGPEDAPAAVPEAAPTPASRGTRGGRGGRGRGRGDASGSESAFRDRDAGRPNNRDRPTDDGVRRDRPANTPEGGRTQRGGRYEGRGGRGGTGGRASRGGRDDRHSRTGIADHPKQAEKGWGEDTAAGELNDENAGQQIALEEEKAAGWDANPDKPVNAEGEHPTAEENNAAAEAEAEAEADKSKSYIEYLAEQAQKKLGLGDSLELRKANEGSKLKVPEGKEVARSDSTDYFVGGGGKQARARERKDKNFLALDHDLIARESASARGSTRGSPRGRGTRGTGERRGDARGRGGGGRGDARGRGGRGGSAAPAITDASAFPSLGS